MGCFPSKADSVNYVDDENFEHLSIKVPESERTPLDSRESIELFYKTTAPPTPKSPRKPKNSILLYSEDSARRRPTEHNPLCLAITQLRADGSQRSLGSSEPARSRKKSMSTSRSRTAPRSLESEDSMLLLAIHESDAVDLESMANEAKQIDACRAISDEVRQKTLERSSGKARKQRSSVEEKSQGENENADVEDSMTRGRPISINLESVQQDESSDDEEYLEDFENSRYTTDEENDEARDEPAAVVAVSPSPNAKSPDFLTELSHTIASQKTLERERASVESRSAASKPAAGERSHSPSVMMLTPVHSQKKSKQTPPKARKSAPNVQNVEAPATPKATVKRSSSESAPRSLKRPAVRLSPRTLEKQKGTKAATPKRPKSIPRPGVKLTVFSSNNTENAKETPVSTPRKSSDAPGSKKTVSSTKRLSNTPDSEKAAAQTPRLKVSPKARKTSDSSGAPSPRKTSNSASGKTPAPATPSTPRLVQHPSVKLSKVLTKFERRKSLSITKPLALVSPRNSQSRIVRRPSTTLDKLPK